MTQLRGLAEDEPSQENLRKSLEGEPQVYSVKRTCRRAEVPRKGDWNVPLHFPLLKQSMSQCLIVPSRWFGCRRGWVRWRLGMIPGIIRGDSRRAIALAKTTKDHGKVKHIDIQLLLTTLLIFLPNHLLVIFTTVSSPCSIFAEGLTFMGEC